MNVILISSAKLATGGARQALYQARSLIRAGCKVNFVSYPGCELRRLAPELAWADLSKNLPNMNRTLRGLMLPGQSTVVHGFHNWGVKLTAYLGTLWRLQRLPVVCAAHRGVTNKPGNPLPYLLPGIRAYMVNSKESGDLLPLLWRRQRCHFVGNAIPAERLQTTRPPAQMLAELNLAPGRLILGDVAHDKPEKGVGRLLEAYARVKNDLPPSNLVIVGVSGKTWQPLCHELGLIRDVRLIPRTERVADYVQIFSLFVFPSYFIESQPNVILEAMALGKPVIGSDIGNVKELIGSDFCFKPGDVEAISAKILWAAQEAERLRQAGAANLAYSARFSEEYRLQTVLDIYRQILKEDGLHPDC